MFVSGEPMDKSKRSYCTCQHNFDRENKMIKNNLLMNKTMALQAWIDECGKNVKDE